MLLSASRSRRRRIDILEPECAKAEFIDEMVDYPNWVCSGHVIVRAPLRLKDLRPSPTLNESLHDRRSYNLYDQKVRHSRALSHSFGRKLPLTFMDSARSLIFVILGLINHRLSEPIAPLSEKTLTEPIAMPSSSPLVLAELAASTRAAADAFIAAGTAANTVRSYQSALAYWSAWLQLRYRRALGGAFEHATA